MELTFLDFSNIPVLEIIIFCFAIMGTPGPVNTLLVVSGINVGVKRTLPAAFVAPIAVNSHVIIASIGLGGLFEIFPQLQITMQIVGSIYLLYLVYKIIYLNAKQKNNLGNSLFRAKDAFFVSLLSPKSFVNASIGVSLFAVQENYVLSVITFGFFYWFSALVSNSIWTIIGSVIGMKIRNPVILQRINYLLGFSLIVVIVLLNKNLF